MQNLFQKEAANEWSADSYRGCYTISGRHLLVCAGDARMIGVEFLTIIGILYSLLKFAQNPTTVRKLVAMGFMGLFTGMVIYDWIAFLITL